MVIDERLGDRHYGSLQGEIWGGGDLVPRNAETQHSYVYAHLYITSDTIACGLVFMIGSETLFQLIPPLLQL
jgi:hypothetical protein